MKAIFEGRASDSPYIEMVWSGRVLADYSPMCPADVRWNLLLLRQEGKLRVSVEGPTTRFVLKNQTAGVEFFVIKFKLGYFLRTLPPQMLVDGDVVLPEGTNRSFWLHSSTWELPTHENAETFAGRLAREGLLVHDKVVGAALHDEPTDVSQRTVRRRFLQATGLTPVVIRQIERAQQAATMLERGMPILDAVYAAGYADQAHLTRALRRFYGQTPAQISQFGLSP